MRQLSKRTQYSLRALYALAANYGGGPMLITNLAQDESIPKKFLEQILPPDQITIAAVIRQIEGPLAPLPCASETQFRKCDECIDIETCGTRIVMREVRDATAAILERTTLASVCRQVEAAKEKQKGPQALMYEI